MKLLDWLLLEKRLRDSHLNEDFPFLLLHSIKNILPCSQAIIFKKDRLGIKVTHALHISEIDRTSPAIEWLEHHLIPNLDNEKVNLAQTPIEAPDFFKPFPQMVYIPIGPNARHQLGLILWFAKAIDPKITPVLELMATSLSDIYKHKWQQTPPKKILPHLRKKHLSIILAIILALGFIRLPQTTIATAEIAPNQPQLVSTSMDGIIQTVLVKPNQTVKKGDVLFTLDDIEIKNQYEEAKHQALVYKERYLKAYRNAFTDNDSKKDLAFLKSEIIQAKIKQKHYASLLARTQIKAKKDGVVLYGQLKDILGKPVQTGERVMLLANPKDKRIDFWLPMDNIVDIEKNQSLIFYPNLAPLSSVKATLDYINFIAHPMPNGQLGYFGQASLESEGGKMGEKGTLKLYGQSKSIWQLILQRPIRFIRQQVGF